MKTAALAILAALALGAPAAVAAPADLGPAVGARIPALQVKDPAGASKSLAELAGPKGAVLVFYRSARWCPYCQAQLIALKDAQAPLAQRGYNLVGISYDSAEVLTRFQAQRGIGYALVSDEGSKTIDAFGLRDPQYKEGSMAHGVPRPAIFVVDRAGVVKAKLAEERYQDRPPVDVVVAAVDRAAR